MSDFRLILVTSVRLSHVEKRLKYVHMYILDVCKVIWILYYTKSIQETECRNSLNVHHLYSTKVCMCQQISNIKVFGFPAPIVVRDDSLSYKKRNSRIPIGQHQECKNLLLTKRRLCQQPSENRRGLQQIVTSLQQYIINILQKKIFTVN